MPSSTWCAGGSAQSGLRSLLANRARRRPFGSRSSGSPLLPPGDSSSEALAEEEGRVRGVLQAATCRGGLDEGAWAVHDKCMAVKTITIDLEAYEALARRKRKGESFSRVIKEHFGRRSTGRDLTALLPEICLSDSTLRQLDGLVRGRRRDRARAPKL